MIETIPFKSRRVQLEGRLFINQEQSKVGLGVVIILTGDGPNGTKSKTWPPMIEALLRKHLSVFIFDFQGQGNSAGDRSCLCLTVGCENFLDAYWALNKRLKLSKCAIGLLGSSFGGAVLLAASSQLPCYDAMALKSPASFLAESYETEHGFPDGMDAWRRNGISSITGLSYEAYVDALSRNLYVDALAINKPVLVVHGTADTIVPISQSRRLCHLLGAKAVLRELPEVGHDYKQQGAQEALQEAVCSFFASALSKS
jgi:pimeloyl-ACP methyl ester carboxylesterase